MELSQENKAEISKQIKIVCFFIILLLKDFRSLRKCTSNISANGRPERGPKGCALGIVRRRCFFYFELITTWSTGRSAAISTEWLSLFAVAISAQKLFKSVRIWFKRKFSYFFAALGALPIALIHLSLKTTLVIIVSHFVFCITRLYYFDTKWRYL